MDVDMEIPELGEHYVLEWGRQIMGEEQDSNGVNLAKTKEMTTGELIKNRYNATLGIFPATQHFASALSENEGTAKLPGITEKLRCMYEIKLQYRAHYSFETF